MRESLVVIEKESWGVGMTMKSDTKGIRYHLTIPNEDRSSSPECGPLYYRMVVQA
jgi:hypothetical protein